MQYSTQYTLIESPIGILLALSNGKELTGLYMERCERRENHEHGERTRGNAQSSAAPSGADVSWLNASTVRPLVDGAQRNDKAPPFQETKEQLDDYFAGRKVAFDLPLHANGTAFQKTVWQELLQIPYGTTISYAELARRIGNPGAFRAVGLANGRNPISLIIPCHRVIGADGSLTGYGGGLANKLYLLNLEKALGRQSPQLQLVLTGNG
jgi:methylated-DNA-[protein]-cysteine S-methyltransferase